MIKTNYNVPQTSFIPQYMGVTLKNGLNDVFTSEFDFKIKNKIESCYKNNNTDGIFINIRDVQKTSNFDFSKYNIEPNTTA